MSFISEVSDSMFDEQVLNSQLPVLVDFWAPWCGPCRTLSPVLEKVAASLQGKVTIYKLNVDDNQNIARQYNVQSIPTLILFKEGKIVAQRSGGNITELKLLEFINSN